MSRPLWKRHGKRAVKIGLAIVVLVALGRHIGQDVARPSEGRVDSCRAGVGRGGRGPLPRRPDCLWHLFRPGHEVESFADCHVPLDPGLSHQPPGQVRAGQGDGGGDAGRPVDTVSCQAGDGGVRHVLRDARHDGRRLVDRGGRVSRCVPNSIGAVPIIARVLLAAAFLALVEPRVFPRLSRLVTSPFPSVGPERTARISRIGCCLRACSGRSWAGPCSG